MPEQEGTQKAVEESTLTAEMSNDNGLREGDEVISDGDSK